MMDVWEHFSNCTKGRITANDLNKYNLAWSISGLVIGAITLASFVVFLFIKAYRTPLQRLFLFLTFFTVIDLTNNSINLILHQSTYNQKLCQVVGYIDVSIFITSLFLVLGIALYLLVVTYYQIQGKSLPKFSKAKSVLVEAGFLVLVVVSPPAALHGNVEVFGVAGPYCWIRVYNEHDCNISDASHNFEEKILTVYTTTMAINIATFTLLIIISCLLAHRHVNVRQHHVHMAKKASLLVFFLSLTFVIDIIAYWCHYNMVDTTTPLPLPALIILGVIVPISPVFIPLGFSVYLYSVRTVKLKALKEKVGKFGRRVLQRAKSKELLSPQSRQQSTCDEDDLSGHTVSREVGYTGAFTTAPPSTYGSVNQTTCSE